MNKWAEGRLSERDRLGCGLITLDGSTDPVAVKVSVCLMLDLMEAVSDLSAP